MLAVLRSDLSTPSAPAHVRDELTTQLPVDKGGLTASCRQLREGLEHPVHAHFGAGSEKLQRKGRSGFIVGRVVAKVQAHHPAATAGAPPQHCPTAVAAAVPGESEM